MDIANANRPRPDLEGLHFKLCVFPFSLYSIMARFTISLGAHYHEGPQGLPKITYKLVNLHRDENLEERYLTTVNQKGQVPVLLTQRNAEPHVAKTVGSLACMEYFPAMKPDEHRAMIDDILNKIHAIEALSLSVKDPDEDDEEEIRS